MRKCLIGMTWTLAGAAWLGPASPARADIDLSPVGSPVLSGGYDTYTCDIHRTAGGLIISGNQTAGATMSSQHSCADLRK
jgi:hypothetical protein